MDSGCRHYVLGLAQRTVSNTPAPGQSLLAASCRNENRNSAPSFELAAKMLDLFATVALTAPLKGKLSSGFKNASLLFVRSLL